MTENRIWGELTRQEIESLRDRGALPVLPLGAIEQHAEHLPVDTDAMNAWEVARRACESLGETLTILLPVQSFGFSPHHKTWPGTVTLSASTLTSMLVDIGESLHRTGFKRALIVNGHGGNTGPLLSACNTLICAGIGVGFVNYFDPGRSVWQGLMQGKLGHLGHACEYETSMQMALRPQLAKQIGDRVKDLSARLEPPFASVGSDAANLLVRGATWAWLFNPEDPGYYGDPASASIETGQALLDTTVSELAKTITAFARAELRVGPEG